MNCGASEGASTAEPSSSPASCASASPAGRDGHDTSCPRLRVEALRASWWETFRCDAAYDEEAACLVVPPVGWTEAAAEPMPVILLLTGNGHVDDRQDFLWGGADTLLLNPLVRERFFLLAPKPTSSSGLLRYAAKSWSRTWAEDAVWALFTEVLRRLGPRHVDASRLYLTGLSLGSAGVWHVALQYGHHFAAAAPISGCCEWPRDSWRGRWPEAGVWERLTSLPMRAYQIDIDHRAGHPGRDVEWLCRDLPSETRSSMLPGIDTGTECEVRVRSWQHEGGAQWELWEARGPLQDDASWKEWGGDSHCLWNRVYPLPGWDLAQFFLQHRVPNGRRWSFDSPPFVADSGATLRQLEAEWYSDGDRKRSRQDAQVDEGAASTRGGDGAGGDGGDAW